jgi:DNA adenine methylase
MKAPFPYFGGKAQIADVVWRYLGQPAHYLEPFFGSGAVLLARRGYNPALHTETVNDADGYVCNVWRAIQFSPQETAKVCDWPVNHADLIARKARLIREENYLLENLCKDDKWHDVELAGYWIWAASCWIGSGLTRPGQRPHLSNKGMSIHMTTCGSIYDWFDRLSERLRRVRVVCGDWSRICGGDWQDKTWPTVGYFFDPPYSVEDRDNGIYHKESLTVAQDVANWCIERGRRENYRIVLAGYVDEHPQLIEAGWRVHQWTAQGGYGNTARSGVTRGQENRKRECLYVSPGCRQNAQANLFTEHGNGQE